jgi:uncharacterized protein YjeT (DUF2065 family)
MGETLLAALALVLIFEGALPLFAPKAWREAFTKMMEMSDGQLRFIGLMAFGIGVVLLMIAT